MSLFFACLAAIAIDGDTIKCRNVPEEGGRVRLARIDAPERREPGADAATAALARLIEGRAVRCGLVDADPRQRGFQKRDRYGRRVARCRAGGVDLGAAMIRGGFAQVWPKRR